jgi:hypothetical protein
MDFIMKHDKAIVHIAQSVIGIPSVVLFSKNTCLE